MELWIAEKPSLAKGIAAHLGRQTGGGNGFIEIDGGQRVMTWCIGHIFEQQPPDHYLPALPPSADASKKRPWRMAELPIIPSKWERRATNAAQYRIIRDLLKKASRIVNAGDPDREGQLLVDEVLLEAGVNPDADNVQRIWLAALDDDSVRKALGALRANREFRNLRLSAQSRSEADWLVGMNGTRAFTLASGSLLTVGRVQTPTLAMVVRRDEAIANFRPKDFFVPWVLMEDGTKLEWKARREPHPGIDEAGRLVDKGLADAILQRIKARCGWEVTRSEKKDVEEPPPLPHSLDSLQVHLDKVAKMSAQQTLDACQSLYEKHKMTTYPRTDCRYLPESQADGRKKVFGALQSGALGKFVDAANPSLQSRCFNDKKITAHHAIIPTGEAPKGVLSKQEAAAFEAIAKFYIAQWYPAARFRQSNLEVLFDGSDVFQASEKQLLSPGWKTVLGGDVDAGLTGQDGPAPKASAEVGGPKGK